MNERLIAHGLRYLNTYPARNMAFELLTGHKNLGTGCD